MDSFRSQSLHCLCNTLRRKTVPRAPSPTVLRWESREVFRPMDRGTATNQYLIIEILVIQLGSFLMPHIVDARTRVILFPDNTHSIPIQ